VWGWWRLGLAAVVVFGALAGAIWWNGWAVQRAEPAIPEVRALPPRVSALGRLAPEGEVVSVAPPSTRGTSSGGRVDELLVDVGDQVTAGQAVAYLDTRRSSAAVLLEARARVGVAQAKLDQVRAGPKPEEVDVQAAVIRRSEAEFVTVEEEYERVGRLIAKRAVAQEEFSAARQKLEQARATLDQSRSQLDALKAVRHVDVKAAETEVVLAEASLAVAKEDLTNTEVRSPCAGRVLCIRTRPGERVGDRGIIDVGNTARMQVVAEIYETDVGKVHIGQPAHVRVPTLGEELSGFVISKDLIVSRKVIFSNDPVADIDARVVEVRVQLSQGDSAKVAGLSNARVNVIIDVSGGAR
jgi:HlyD family secretion protein